MARGNTGANSRIKEVYRVIADANNKVCYSKSKQDDYEYEVYIWHPVKGILPWHSIIRFTGEEFVTPMLSFDFISVTFDTLDAKRKWIRIFHIRPAGIQNQNARTWRAFGEKRL
jgi:hypothetical protein